MLNLPPDFPILLMQQLTLIWDYSLPDYPRLINSSIESYVEVTSMGLNYPCVESPLIYYVLLCQAKEFFAPI